MSVWLYQECEIILCISRFRDKNFENKQSHNPSFITYIGYIGDVFIIASHRGQGLGKWLMQCIMSHPDVKALKKIMLATTDAHSLYRQYGFKPLGHPEWVMERYNRDDFQNFSVA